MLNEILEAQEYMYDLNNADYNPERIVCGTFLKGASPAFSGLERILTIIGRRFMFPDNIDDLDSLSSDDYSARIFRAAAALRMWCGLVPKTFNNQKLREAYDELSTDPVFRNIENWLPRYLEKALNDGKIKAEKYTISIDKLSSRKKSFAKPVLFMSETPNDYNAIKYDKVIANGTIANGPLREYCLVCENGKWYEGIIKKSEKKGTKKKALAAISDKDYDTILKITAAYLLERKRKKREFTKVSFEPTNFQVLSFWIGVNKDSQKVKVYYYNDRLLFETRPVGEKQYILPEEDNTEGAKKRGVNATKLKPDEEWFNKCGWDIIDITENDNELKAFLDTHPDAIWFTDTGGGRPLVLHRQKDKSIAGKTQ